MSNVYGLQLAASMHKASKLRTAVADLVARPTLRDALLVLCGRKHLAASAKAQALLYEECKALNPPS